MPRRMRIVRTMLLLAHSSSELAAALAASAPTSSKRWKRVITRSSTFLALFKAF